MPTFPLNGLVAWEAKLAFLAASAAGDCAALFAYADWLEDNGSPREARRWRLRAAASSSLVGNDACGRPNNRFQACWHLGLMADGLVSSCMAFRRFTYHGGYVGPYGAARPSADDGSLEYLMRTEGHVPTLRRGLARQARLGRVLEAVGLGVSWIS